MEVGQGTLIESPTEATGNGMGVSSPGEEARKLPEEEGSHAGQAKPREPVTES